MSDEKKINFKDKEISINHLCYLGGVLSEAIRNFHADLLSDLARPAAEIITRPHYMRIMSLTDSFEEAIRLCYISF